MKQKCAALRCRRPGVVRVELDAGWPGPPGPIVRYFLCRPHASQGLPKSMQF